nr:MAG TPA: hypothetical protein [Herelleviridae sp. ctsMP6]
MSFLKTVPMSLPTALQSFRRASASESSMHGVNLLLPRMLANVSIPLHPEGISLTRREEMPFSVIRASDFILFLVIVIGKGNKLMGERQTTFVKLHHTIFNTRSKIILYCRLVSIEPPL